MGGCNHYNAVQNYVHGAGDRIIWCFNIYGYGADYCANEGSAQRLAGTAPEMVNDVCNAPGADGFYAQGYVSRALVVDDPRSNPPAALIRCGLVQIDGQTGYNGTCDPTDGSTQNGGNSQAWASSGTGRICNGDYAVAIGQYYIWGYLHVALNQAAVSSGANTEAQNFVKFMQSDPDEVQDYGFLQPCQMAYQRTQDGGALSVTSSSC